MPRPFAPSLLRYGPDVCYVIWYSFEPVRRDSMLTFVNLHQSDSNLSTWCGKSILFLLLPGCANRGYSIHFLGPVTGPNNLKKLSFW